ncbi:DoxX family protein [Niabella hibiscisoli]|uniref:DoxX family protein n=1 Tax=Niabella hibiscisoli TaxID=1825928 RepID=UPI001F10421E|nr:DoxX family protein [Niabella hibiscisoli]MCH5714912.1 DoxX family protein [Niabella hibiscisoli]
MRLMTSKYAEPSVSIALLLLRVIAGSSMLMNHGLKKISNFNAIVSKGFADPFHIGTKASLSLTIFAEVFCAGLLIIGLLTRLASLPLIVAMVIALFFAHGGQIFGEGESAGLFLTMYVVIFLMGPGKFSLDKKIGK